MDLETIIIGIGDIALYNELRSQGYMCRWVGDGMICMGLPKNWEHESEDAADSLDGDYYA